MFRILRGLTSCHLRCGCVVGIYETYDGRVVSILDARGDYCHQPQHEPGVAADGMADGAAGTSSGAPPG